MVRKQIKWWRNGGARRWSGDAVQNIRVAKRPMDEVFVDVSMIKFLEVFCDATCR